MLKLFLQYFHHVLNRHDNDGDDVLNYSGDDVVVYGDDELCGGDVVVCDEPHLVCCCSFFLH